MGIQQYKGAFRTSDGATNVYEALSVGAGAGRDLGATIVDQVQLVPPMMQTWRLLQISIVATLIMVSDNWIGLCGKLPRIYGGLAQGIAQSWEGASPMVVPMQALPSDQGGIGLLWDPANDPLPPLGTFTTRFAIIGLPVELNVSLPQPVSIMQGELVGVGIWLEGALLATPTSFTNAGLVVMNANYCVTYDDGQPEPRAL